MVDSTEFTAQFQEEAQRTVNRIQAVIDSFVVNPVDPPIAVTPNEVIWKRGKTRLLRYRPQNPTPKPLPYLIIPWLGISRPYVLDLLPGNSFIEFLVEQGHDVYLLDWGEIAEEDKGLGFEEGVFKIIPRAIDRALEASNANEINLNGICLGGTLSACFLALNPDAPVRSFIAVVAPIDFDEGGLFKVWLDDRHFPTDLFVERYGGVPASLMASGFKMLRPTMEAQALSSLWSNIERPDYVTNFKAMSRWANDYIGMPGRFFRQLAKELYGKNQLMRKEFVINGLTGQAVYHEFFAHQLILAVQFFRQLAEEPSRHPDVVVGPSAHRLEVRHVIRAFDVGPKAGQGLRFHSWPQHLKAGRHQASGHAAVPFHEKVGREMAIVEPDLE